MTDASVSDLILSTIHTLTKATDFYSLVNNDERFPEAFHEASRGLHLIEEAFEIASRQLNGRGLAGDPQSALILLEACSTRARLSMRILRVVSRAPKTSRFDLYKAAVQVYGEGKKIEELTLEMMNDICDLAKDDAIKEAMEDKIQALHRAMNKLSTKEPSVPNDGPAWTGADIPRGYYDITELVDQECCLLRNADRKIGSLSVLFDGSKPSSLESTNELVNDWVESGRGAQLMLFVFFESMVNLRTIQLTSLPPKDGDHAIMRPKRIRLYVNWPYHLGFVEAKDREATQDIVLQKKDWNSNGTANVALELGNFENVYSLVLFVVDEDGRGFATRLDRLRFFGTEKRLENQDSPPKANPAIAGPEDREQYRQREEQQSSRSHSPNETDEVLGAPERPSNPEDEQPHSPGSSSDERQPLLIKDSAMLEVPQEAIEELPDSSFKVHWRCKCGTLFHSIMKHGDRQVAEDFYRDMHWDKAIDGPYTFRWPDWILRLSLMWSPRFYSDLGSDNDLTCNNWADAYLLPSAQQPSQGQNNADENNQDLEAAYPDHPTTDVGTDSTVADDTDAGDSDYICLCFKSREGWRLRQIRISSTPDENFADQKLFKTIQDAVIMRKRPVWVEKIRRPLLRAFCERCLWYWTSWVVPINVADIAYHEFLLFDEHSNFQAARVEEESKGKLPCDDTHASSNQSNVAGPSKKEWSWTCDKDEPKVKIYLSEELLLYHFLLDPSHVPTGKHKGARYWRWIPRKLKERLTCPASGEGDKPGWGLVLKMEWDHTTFFLSCTLPILIVALAITVTLSVHFKWPVSTGFALFAGILALDVFVFQIIQAKGKQRGLVE